MVDLGHVDLAKLELCFLGSPSQLSPRIAWATRDIYMICGRWTWNNGHILCSPNRLEQALGPVAAPVCWSRAHLIGSGLSDSWVRCVRKSSFSCRSPPPSKVEIQRGWKANVSSSPSSRVTGWSLLFLTSYPSFLPDHLPCGLQAPAPDMETASSHGPHDQLPQVHKVKSACAHFLVVLIL